MRAACLNDELTDVLHEETEMTDIAVVGLDCRFPQAAIPPRCGSC